MFIYLLVPLTHFCTLLTCFFFMFPACCTPNSLNMNEDGSEFIAAADAVDLTDVQSIIESSNEARADGADLSARAAALGIPVDPPSAPPIASIRRPTTTNEIFEEYNAGPPLPDIESMVAEACGGLDDAARDLIAEINQLDNAIETYFLDRPDVKESSRPLTSWTDRGSFFLRRD